MMWRADHRPVAVKRAHGSLRRGRSNPRTRPARTPAQAFICRVRGTSPALGRPEHRRARGGGRPAVTARGGPSQTAARGGPRRTDARPNHGLGTRRYGCERNAAGVRACPGRRPSGADRGRCESTDRRAHTGRGSATGGAPAVAAHRRLVPDRAVDGRRVGGGPSDRRDRGYGRGVVGVRLAGPKNRSRSRAPPRIPRPRVP